MKKGDIVLLTADGSNLPFMIVELLGINNSMCHIVNDKIDMITNIKNVTPLGQSLSELVR